MWQCGKLRNGKYKGFIDQDYRIRSVLSVQDEENWTVVADRLSTGERVAVRITRLKGPPWTQYTVAADVDPALLAE
jgi:hypothetical protein